MTTGNIIIDATSGLYHSAYQVLQEVGSVEFAGLCAKLGFCIGGYSFDKNPQTLEIVGEETLGALKEVREAHPDAVDGSLIEKLEESLHKA